MALILDKTLSQKQTQPPTPIPLEKPVKLDDFCLSFPVKNQIWSLEILPPCWKIRICFALSAGCSCCGGEILQIPTRELPCSLPPASSSPCQLRFCLLNCGSETEDGETTGSDKLEG
ncbi:hypothetical protein SLEP1_g22183 [Rubroshorea leprosula]|uniref:Uncharacterized protein n=1 Tax=Rubroshorea leprosula TaxID=152421 RepID=A0AAV5JJ88_9ROSI|nr:hypothetical protein SLEP1_g22183 [Rubroshorea leprosula]